MEQTYLTEKQACARYGIGSRTLRLMRMRGAGPRYVKVSGRLGCRGGRIIYPVAAFEAWLESLPSGGGKSAEAS